jgi:hypothetical protein
MIELLSIECSLHFLPLAPLPQAFSNINRKFLHLITQTNSSIVGFTLSLSYHWNWFFCFSYTLLKKNIEVSQSLLKIQIRSGTGWGRPARHWARAGHTSWSEGSGGLRAWEPAAVDASGTHVHGSRSRARGLCDRPTLGRHWGSEASTDGADVGLWNW